MYEFVADRTPSPRPLPRVDLDRKSLERDLRRHLRGEVRFDGANRAMYSAAADNYRQVPIGVVIPRDGADIEAALAACRRYRAPVVFRGGGTGLAGQTVNQAVLLDISKYLRTIISLDPSSKRARVQPGVVLDQLRKAAGRYQLTFGPDPATHDHCTLGGMIGNNSCGVHSVMAGRTADNIFELDVVTYDGVRMRVGQTSEAELAAIIGVGGRRSEIYAGLKTIRDRYGDLIRARYPRIPRRVSGYNLDELLPEQGFNVARALVGTEGTCVAVLEATVRLVDDPPCRVLLVLGFPDIYSAGDHAAEVTEYGAIACEALDDRLIHFNEIKHAHRGDIRILPSGGGWLLVEFNGQTRAEAEAKARRLMDAMERKATPPSMKLFEDKKEEKRVWEVRESGLGATAWVPGYPAAWPGWEDSAVPPERVGNYLRDLRRLMDRYEYEAALYGHLGQGCVHCRISFDLATEDGIRKYRSFISEAADLVVSYGGSLSGEHGDGQSRAEFLPKMFGPELMEAFGQFKRLWDPDNRMNPHKVVEPHPIDQDLRLGPDYRPPEPATYFQYPEDDFSFSRAAMRCVGVGKCRHLEGGTMCPSFMATREEMHSTRGRARLLFEMLQGNPVTRGWRDSGVREALDLCLSCKGCKGECPVNVDMATYKAEFLAHYYKGRLRPLAAYSMGLIFNWARLASYAPGIANLLTQTPGLSHLARWAGGIDLRRPLPRFASQTFKSWFSRRALQNVGAPQVILWPDTFNNYFHPEVAQAAVAVLEQAGYQVLVPQPALCCGRPLYDYGMLALARRKLWQILDALRPQISAGIPMVGLEPSCVSVFRDELKSMLAHDSDAARLSGKTFTLAEFLEKEAHFTPPQLNRAALVHGHCHQKSILDFETEEQFLRKMGLDLQIPEEGCCGLAGSFGFERGTKYRVSMQCGERLLLPAVRQRDPHTLVISDGFSCRTQIQQNTGCVPLHSAQVTQMALAADRKLAFGRSMVAMPRLYPQAASDHQWTPPANFIDGDGARANHNHRWRNGGLALGLAAGSLAIAYLAARYGMAGAQGSWRSRLG